MKTIYLTNQIIQEYESSLFSDEKSQFTIQKYIRDVRKFMVFLNGASISKEITVRYKETLLANGYAVESINSILASLNSLFRFLHCEECSVRQLRRQRRVYCPEERELTKVEYLRMVQTAEKNPRLQLVMETICSTGIRVSELQYFTVESVRKGEINVSCKNKIRTIFIPGKLRKKLIQYAKQRKIKDGAIFCTRTGKPLNRSNIWADMKRLCKSAKVSAKKVFPHNLRKLFARTFYKIEKEIAVLADLLGHSSINTTRIYIITTGVEHRKKIEQMGLVS